MLRCPRQVKPPKLSRNQTEYQKLPLTFPRCCHLSNFICMYFSCLDKCDAGARAAACPAADPLIWFAGACDVKSCEVLKKDFEDNCMCVAFILVSVIAFFFFFVSSVDSVSRRCLAFAVTLSLATHPQRGVGQVLCSAAQKDEDDWPCDLVCTLYSHRCFCDSLLCSLSSRC